MNACEPSKRAGGRGHLIIFAPPKAGSTFFQNCLARYLDVGAASYADQDSGPNGVSKNRFLELRDRTLVTKTHALAGHTTEFILRSNGRLPFLMKRNVCDAIVSMRDHKVSRLNTRKDVAISRMPHDIQLRLVAYEWLDWYFRYFAGWSGLTDQTSGPYWVDYDRLVKDPVHEIAVALKAYGHTADLSRLAGVVEDVSSDRELSNKNVGISGRGVTLPGDVKQAVAEYRSILLGLGVAEVRHFIDSWSVPDDVWIDGPEPQPTRVDARRNRWA